MPGTSLAYTWGSTAVERKMRFPCDDLLDDADDEYFRALDIRAPVEVLFRWLCQLKVAPYSYDLLDNLGRRSPRRLTPGAEDLEKGQKVMTIFEIVEFERDRHLTVEMRDPRAIAVFGRVAVSYAALRTSEGSCRLIAKLRVRYSRRMPLSLTRPFLAWGDLVMMRKQLLTLKRLAESGTGLEMPKSS